MSYSLEARSSEEALVAMGVWGTIREISNDLLVDPATGPRSSGCQPNALRLGYCA